MVLNLKNHMASVSIVHFSPPARIFLTKADRVTVGESNVVIDIKIY